VLLEDFFVGLTPDIVEDTRWTWARLLFGDRRSANAAYEPIRLLTDPTELHSLD